MTEVLALPLQPQPDNGSHLGALRRTTSQSSIFLQGSSSYSESSQNLKSKYSNLNHPASEPSSAPSSPRIPQPDFSNQPSYLSTPSSSLSLDEQCAPEEEPEISFPSYDDGDVQEKSVGDRRGRSRTRPADDEPPPSPVEPMFTPTSSAAPLNDPPPKAPSYPQIPELVTAGDDTAISREPTRHVDYLSHNWKEEDIWASWRHIVSRRQSYGNNERLENAVWRTWSKSLYRLKTVSPERLNW